MAEEENGKEPIEKSTFSKISETLTPFQFVILIFAISATIYLVFVKKMLAGYEGLFILIIFIVALIFSLKRKEDTHSSVTIEEAQKIIKQYVINQQNVGNFPVGTIEMIPDFKIKRVGYTDQFRTIYVGVRIISDSFSKEYLGQVHPKTGQNLGLREVHDGIQMNKIEDFRIIPQKQEEQK